MLQFNWTIDDVAKIQPAPIEEFNFQHLSMEISVIKTKLLAFKGKDSIPSKIC